MVGAKTSKKDVFAFVGMMMSECMIVGGNTLYKSATAQETINSYVFTFYVFLTGFIFLLPCLLFQLYRTSVPSMPFSIVIKIFMLSVIVMEKINFRNYTSQAKVIGTIVSLSGAFIATFYNGPILLTVSMSKNWIIGGIILITQYILQSFALVAQAKIMDVYPVDLVAMFAFTLSGLLVAGLGALVMARDFDLWKLKPNIVLATILYMGLSSGFLIVMIQIWTLRVKGPVYVAMFKPLTILIAIIMGVLFLGDLLHLGSVIGGVIITIGFYGVLWGKSEEETATTTASTSSTTPLL